MEQTSPIYLSKEEFLSVQKRKIGYGKDGVTFRYNRQEIIKIYHQNLENIMLSLTATEKDSVKIYEKGNYDERVFDVLTAYIYNEESDERLKLPSKNAIKLAIEKQKRITKTRLPKNLVYVEKIFAGCLIDYQKGIQIHKLKGLPFSLKRQITMEILKIVGIGIITTIVIIIIKQIKPEFAVVALISGVIIMLYFIFSYFGNVLNVFNQILNKTGVNSELFGIILKIVGVGYIIEFGASICADSGNPAIADKIILGGKLLILVLAMPIITNLLDLIIGLIP